MRIDHASASARSASRIAFWAASRAPWARISAPMTIAAPDDLSRFGAHGQRLQRHGCRSRNPRPLGMTSASWHFRLVKQPELCREKVAKRVGTVDAGRRRVRSDSTTTVEGEMALHFSRVGPATEELEIWSASERGFSFVISNESRSGPGLHGRPGYVASWRPINLNRPAIRVGGSPFKTFAEAE